MALLEWKEPREDWSVFLDCLRRESGCWRQCWSSCSFTEWTKEWTSWSLKEEGEVLRSESVVCRI